MESKALNIRDLTTKHLPTWCSFCGNYNILQAVKMALVKLNIPQYNTLIVTGIGCGSKINHYIKAYGFEGLHGRGLAVATGAKLANHKLNVIAVAGDGDGYGIGGNHLIHTMRRNINIIYIVQDNAVYGLTKGQMSPTSRKGFKSPSTPQGSIEEPTNPVSLGIVGGASYVARGFAFDLKHLVDLITKGIQHKGFSMIDVLQPCSTYNRINTLDWYKSRVYKLEDVGHTPSDKMLALSKSEEWDPKIPTGLFYQESRNLYEDNLPQIAAKPLAEHDISNIDIKPALKKFK